jgi:hypothetical protein
LTPLSIRNFKKRLRALTTSLEAHANCPNGRTRTVGHTAYAATQPNPCSSIYPHRARSLVATTGRPSLPACRPTPGAQVFFGPFAGDEHHQVRPPPWSSLPAVRTEHPNPNSLFVFGSDLISVYACVICLPTSIVLQNYWVYMVYPCPLLGPPLVGWLVWGQYLVLVSLIPQVDSVPFIQVEYIFQRHVFY